MLLINLFCVPIKNVLYRIQQVYLYEKHSALKAISCFYYNFLESS